LKLRHEFSFSWFFGMRKLMSDLFRTFFNNLVM
jgi:hypothetical protein